MRRVTIKDIAEHLLISVSTVSRALSDDKNIRRETKEKVLAAAKELGYKPNPVATNLKYGRTNTVGVIVPETITPYASQVIKGIQSVLNGEGLKVIIAESNESWESERENLDTMERFMVDGIIVSICDYKRNKEEFLQLESRGVPMVFFDRIPYEMDMTQVVVDDYIQAFFMVEHLIREGCSKIVHLRGPENIYNSELRVKGYSDAMRKFKMEENIINGGVTFEEGATTVDKLLDKGVEFDAVFAFTDTVAIGAMNRLRERGKSIPNDVSIASFSGTVLSTIVYPQLTTIEPPLVEMGIESAKLLLEKIKNDDAPIRSVVLGAKKIIRESTKRNI